MAEAKGPKGGGGKAVPQGSTTRLAKLGGLAAGVMGGMAAEGARRLAAGERPDLRRMLLTPANAARVADRLAEMRGAAMKVGQLLSMEAGDLLPPELTEILSRLRAEARPMPGRQLKQVLTAEWGAGFLRKFDRFDVTPVAAASIGQVHRARTKDGRDLAVKVQYPGVRASIDSDVNNVATLIRLSGLAPDGFDVARLLDEAKRQLHEEADYRREAAQMARFHALLGDDPAFELPEPADDLCTDNLLAMTFLEGRPIESAETLPQEDRDRIAAALLALALREVLD
ncbi:MAG: AarF/ABC1/UbiB kinase family protein, partial [Pseudomonadota bacterium]